MSGFESGNSQGAISRSLQFGPILRGYGPPVPEVGVSGSLYLDVVSWQLFERRGSELDPWGHYLFVLPVAYRNSLNYFGTTPPDNNFGGVGDYYMLWGGSPNYGTTPIVYGPKLWTGWPTNGDGPSVAIANGGNVIKAGLVDEGGTIADGQLTQLIAVGLQAEYIIPVPVTANTGELVGQLGLQSTGGLINITLNPLYTAEDQHSI